MSPIYELFLSTFPIVPEVFLLATFDPKFAKDFPVGGRKKKDDFNSNGQADCSIAFRYFF